MGVPTTRPECLFCQIIEGKVPSKKLYEDADCICIKDKYPNAKTHLLVIPKKHIASMDEMFPGDATNEQNNDHEKLIGHLMKKTVDIARQLGLLPGGYKTVIHTNKLGGQVIFHLHIHLMCDHT